METPQNDALRTPTEALQVILAHAERLGTQSVLLPQALGRVLAEDIQSDRLLPPWDNSAMDGYAVRAQDIGAAPLPVCGTIAAGHPATEALAPGTVLRIMTGAPMPLGADAVIMREDADEQDGQVRFSRVPVPSQHIRRAGEDLRPGDQVLPRGTTLGPGEIGLCAALGRLVLHVTKKPLVSVVATGDELVPPDRIPEAGQIVNSNSYALAAQIAEAGGEARLVPIVPDDPVAMRAAFADALTADVVVSTGGVSVGQFDYVRQILRELGAVECVAKVAMKPGKPISVSVLTVRCGAVERRVLWLGLPGNPASSMVSFELFVRPALRAMAGHAQIARPELWVILAREVTPDRQRLHFARARLVRREEPQGLVLWAEPLFHQGSGMLRSMLAVSALLHIPPGTQVLPAGTQVRATLLCQGLP